MNTPQAEKDLSGKEEMKNKKIMVVEDNDANTLLMKILLRTAGVPVENISYAKNGLEAVEMAKQELFDVIFMDVKMPILDGISASKMIRSDKINGSIPKIIMCTADISSLDKASDKKTFDDVMLKPFNQYQFMDALTNALEPENEEPQGEDKESEQQE